MNRGGDSESTAGTLRDLLSAARLRVLRPEAAAKFEEYLSLLLRWNSRMNLTAVRDPEDIVLRHFVESIACAQLLPPGIASLLDFGSGAGFPGIPIALCRPEIRVALAESQTKKAAFLHEAVRTLKLNACVFSQRAEKLVEQFDCVTLRAVDRMEQAVAAASRLVKIEGGLAVMTTLRELPIVEASAASEFSWSEPIPLPGSEQRVLALASKAVSAA